MTLPDGIADRDRLSYYDRNKPGDEEQTGKHTRSELTAYDANNSEFVSLKLDPVTRFQCIIPTEHCMIHGGNHYYIEGYTTLANAGELRVKLVTPDTTKWSHFLWEIESSGGLVTQFYEGASGGMAGGSAVTPLNNNRNSTNTSGVVITSGVAVATADGLLISQASWKKRTQGSQVREDELILKRDTIYLRKFTSTENDNLVRFKASWYEHTDLG